MRKFDNTMRELRDAAKHPENYNVPYICGKAMARLTELARETRALRQELRDRAAHQGEWLALSDPLLKRLWGEYRRRYADTEMEVLVIVGGAITATTAFFDGEDFIDGVDLIPVRCWMPLPAPPKGDPNE